MRRCEGTSDVCTYIHTKKKGFKIRKQRTIMVEIEQIIYSWQSITISIILIE